MNVDSALKAGQSGLIFTIVSIIDTLTAGYFFGKALK
jgi:hypothetical protein